MKRLKPHLTYANVLVTLLAFVVLGGVAVAAVQLPKNSVGTKQLKKNAVSAAKIKAGAVSGAKVKDGSLTGSDINAGTLGTVPSAQAAQLAQAAKQAELATAAKTAESASDAEKLGGRFPEDFAAADRFLFGSRSADSLFHLTLFELPGGVSVQTDGDADDGFALYMKNTADRQWWISTPTVTVVLPPNGEGNVTIPEGNTALLVMAADDDPAQSAALECALVQGPDDLTCFATLSPGLAAQP